MVQCLLGRVLGLLVVAATLGGCGSDSDGEPSGSSNDDNCLASSIVLTETDLTDAASSHAVLIDFDAKNTSSKDYDISKGSSAIELDFEVTTTDGSKYESTAPLTATKISAGATAAAVAMADYGANKTYESYTVTLRCR
jgi:hypothetical protein